MGYFSYNNKKVCVTELGQSLIDYAILLTIVITAFVGMNVYVKRGFQGRIRDMIDYFICDKHLIQMSLTTSESWVDTTVKVNKKELPGGGTKLTYLTDDPYSAPEVKIQHTESVTEDLSSFSPHVFVPTDGHRETPEYPESE